MRRPTGFLCAAVLMISAAVAMAAGANSAGEDEGEVERMSSLTVTEVPRSGLRDVNAEISNAERAKELRADLGVEEGNGEARMAMPGDVLFGFDEARVRDSAEPLLADVAEWFAKHCICAGLPRIRLHDVRHTYASVALAQSTDWHEIKVISERLGHASIGITLDTYAHVLPVADERTAHTLASHILGRT